MKNTSAVDSAPVEQLVGWPCFVFRFVAIPLLVLLYVGAIVPLTIRQLSHRLTWCFDWSFDSAVRLAGWDSRFWPLPKASDELLPWGDS
jgi:hypothetical protein